HAIVHSDTDRALRDLQAMQTTANAFDWDMFLVGELVNIALRSIYYESIQRSLYADVWSTEQLEQLMEQVGQPLPLAQSWNASIESEKAMALSYVSGSQPPQPIGLLLSAESKLDLMRKYAEIQSLSGVPLGRLSRKAAELERTWESERSGIGVDTLSSTILPAVFGYANAFERWERNRRLVLTSLAVKRFQAANNRWPAHLLELTQVGLSPEDWTLPGIGSLGYAIEPDGKTACVWAVGDKDSDVAGQCPDYAGDKLKDVQYYLTVIK
ncbi:MAG: hypothetical protein KDA72_18095, partial [Planctomycetales bacterium]|nr:hypothetical protein [Planctomycetales bacterium]